MDPSSTFFTSFGNESHFGFGAGVGQKTMNRRKPRFIKLKKNGKTMGRTGEIPSGFNPFTPPNKGSNGESLGDKCFVFGANGNTSDAKATNGSNATVTPSSDDEEFGTPVGDFVFGWEVKKEHSEGVSGKINNCNPENVTRNGRSINGLRFVGGENGSWKNVKNSDAFEKDIRRQNGVNKNTSESTSCFDTNSGNTISGSVFNLHADMKKLNINDNGIHCGNEEARKSTNGPAFVFGSSGKVDAESKGAASSFSSNGFHQSDNAAARKPTVHSETTDKNKSTTFGTKTSFDGFKVPQWDPSSFKNSLFPDVNRNPVHAQRNRISKDKKSKKLKEKVKQSGPVQCNDQASEGIESKEKPSSPGYCSPMDFSPYRGEKPNDQFPTENPLTSINLSHLRDGLSFSASTFQGVIPNKKLQAVKKYRRKANIYATMRNNQENQHVNTGQAKQESGSTSVLPDVCEVWRLRGNQAYKNGDIGKAEECYTHGINSSPSRDNSEYSVKPHALCYGNRAAARISLGRLREAISDCEMAASLDPSYIKAYKRAAKCYLVLGELESAVQYFNKCMESASSVCLDRQTTIESAEGLQQAQRVADYIKCASIFLEKKTSDGASDALVPIANALLISSCSDKLLQMKAEALLMVRKYKEVIELCENTLQTAEKNSVSPGLGGTENADELRSKDQSLIVWRWNMISRSHFYLGNLEMALDKLEKLQQMGSSRNENQEDGRDSPTSLVATISELLRYKNAGNEAVRAGKYMEAVEQYTAALSKNVDSRPFAAICFCNRAAANQALVQIADAIADCSLAMALDENYTKAVSRRATLHEMIRDYNQAASDLQRLIKILVKQNDEKTKTVEASDDRASRRKELKQARQRLSVMEEKSKEGIPLDFYLLMGVKKSDTGVEIKKAYRKAALRHHPDKSAQILVRSESEGPWMKEILEEVHKDADRLFKMIGEAYSVLSDQTKRSEYELEEDIRKTRTCRESYKYRNTAEASSPPYRTSPGKQYWKERRTYRNWW